MKSSKGVILLIVGIMFSITTGASAVTPIRVVNGIFKDVDGRPVASRGAVVYSSDGLTTFVTSDAQGKFRTQVRNGEITIQLGGGWGTYTQDRTINLTSSDTEISIIFPRLKTYTVNVKDSNGVGVANIQTSICAGDHGSVTQSDGQVLTFLTQCQLDGWSNESGKTSITGFELANQNYLTDRDWNKNGEIDGLITYYYPFEGVQLVVYTEMSDWSDGLVDIVLPDVPSIDVIASSQMNQGESSSIQISLDSPIAPLALRSITQTSISNYSGSQVTIWSRNFENSKKPGAWIQGKTATVKASGVAVFSVSPSKTSQFQIRGTSLSASSKSFTIRVKAAIAYKNCTALNKVYKGGVAKSKSSKNTKKKNGKKVLAASKYKPSINPTLYSKNEKLDKDADGIVCEK
jgi:hypothetical protein